MKQEDKELLIKDLCARIPYGVKAKIGKEIVEITSFDKESESVHYIVEYNFRIADDAVLDVVKPYLFPMSSMTETQVEEHCDIFNTEYIDVMLKSRDKPFNETLVFYKCTDWFNANHFDYRGLIEKGLAIDATNLNIY